MKSQKIEEKWDSILFRDIKSIVIFSIVPHIILERIAEREQNTER